MAVIGVGIPGRPGTLPQGPTPDDRFSPPEARAPRVGRPQPARSSPRLTVDSPRVSPRADELVRAIAAARRHRDELMQKRHVIGVRAGYKFTDGRIRPEPAVVVLVDQKVALDSLARRDRVPAVVDNVLTDVAPADTFERLARVREEAVAVLPRPPRLLIDELQTPDEALEEAVPVITYEPPPGADLDAVTGAMTVTCHVSPDAGWKVLETFLSATENQICLGMYDFTAPHIYQAVRALLKRDQVTWRQTLGPKESLPGEDDVDSTKADDLTEEQVTRGLRRVARDRFESAFAHVGSGQTFASAYHIKVAVRDRKSFWLSSGNWQSSNQPDIDFLQPDADVGLIPRFNREWHVVVDHPALAKLFQVFLEHDFRTARAPVPEAVALEARPDLLIPVEEFLFEEERAAELEVFAPRKFVFTNAKPLTVQPILTPDNYTDIVLKLLRKRPQQRLYFQNQSLNPVKQPTPEFEELMQLLVDYSNDENLDVRLIFRNIGSVRKKLESLQAAGFNMKRVRMQSGCHTKGIVIDSKTVLIGSHNFTNQGVLVNRDASLLITNEEIAGYFERVFLHDWTRLSRETIREEAVAIPLGAPGAEAVADPDAYVRVPWTFLSED
jgi:phospholipase D-like protein